MKSTRILFGNNATHRHTPARSARSASRFPSLPPPTPPPMPKRPGARPQTPNAPRASHSPGNQAAEEKREREREEEAITEGFLPPLIGPHLGLPESRKRRRLAARACQSPRAKFHCCGWACGGNCLLLLAAAAAGAAAGSWLAGWAGCGAA